MTAAQAIESARALIASLAGTHERGELPPSVHERVAAWFWGACDEEIVGYIGLCDMVAADPVAKHLYLFHCAEDMSGEQAVKDLEAWCAGMAAECAVAINSRKRLRIPSYKPEWGRQAGNDGAALAMWGDRIRDLLPGVNKRAERYGCRDEAYLRVREHVQIEADDLIGRFKRDMEQAECGRFDPDFRARWEAKTGRPFPKA